MLRNLQSQIAALKQAEQAPVSPFLPPANPALLLPLTYIGDVAHERDEAEGNPIDAPRIDYAELDPTRRLKECERRSIGIREIPSTPPTLCIAGR